MNRPQFSNNLIYHIYNRGVEKRNVFLEDRDYQRFIADVAGFNSAKSVLNHGYHLIHGHIEVGLQYGKKLVEILAFCLMPNHYHLLLRQKADGGITEFMRKLGTGYTNYFNLKYTRVGHLFQGKFKAVLVAKETHFNHLPHYIHLNPLDILRPQWRESQVSYEETLNVLKKYRWSSLPNYLGSHAFEFVSTDFLLGCAGGAKNFANNMREALSNGNFAGLREVTIDY